jgi:hypothetical protein
MYYPSFNDPDSLVYLKDANIILSHGYWIPSHLSQDPYYRGFPIFTLIIVLSNLISGINLQTLILVLTLVSNMIFITLFLKILSALRLNPHGMILASFLGILGNAYLLRLLQSPLPFNLSLIVNSLMIYMIIRIIHLKINIIADIINLIFIGILSLNHAEYLYISIYILILFLYSSLIKNNNRKIKKYALSALALFGLLGYVYILLNGYVQTLVTRSFLFLHLVLPRISELRLMEAQPIERPFPFVTAISYSCHISASAATAMIAIIKLLLGSRSECDEEAVFHSLAISISLMFATGVIWYLFRPVGYGNVMMYAYINGYLLAPFIWIYIAKISSSNLNRYSKLIFSILLIISIWGSLSDPLAMPNPENSLLINSIDYPKYKLILCISRNITQFEKFYVNNLKITTYSSIYNVCLYYNHLSLTRMNIIFNIEEGFVIFTL